MFTKKLTSLGLVILMAATLITAGCTANQEQDIETGQITEETKKIEYSPDKTDLDKDFESYLGTYNWDNTTKEELLGLYRNTGGLLHLDKYDNNGFTLSNLTEGSLKPALNFFDELNNITRRDLDTKDYIYTTLNGGYDKISDGLDVISPFYILHDELQDSTKEELYFLAHKSRVDYVLDEIKEILSPVIGEFNSNLLGRAIHEDYSIIGLSTKDYNIVPNKLTTVVDYIKEVIREETDIDVEIVLVKAKRNESFDAFNIGGRTLLVIDIDRLYLEGEPRNEEIFYLAGLTKASNPDFIEEYTNRFWGDNLYKAMRIARNNTSTSEEVFLRYRDKFATVFSIDSPQRDIAELYIISHEDWEIEEEIVRDKINFIRNN